MTRAELVILVTISALVVLTATGLLVWMIWFRKPKPDSYYDRNWERLTGLPIHPNCRTLQLWPPRPPSVHPIDISGAMDEIMRGEAGPAVARLELALLPWPLTSRRPYDRANRSDVVPIHPHP